MSFSQLLLIIAARRKLIMATLGLFILVALAVSLIMPKTYRSTATVVLNPGVDPVTGQALPGQLVPSYLATQVGILQSRGLALKVVHDLKLAQRELFQKKFQAATDGAGDPADWTASHLLKKLTVKPTRESNVIDLSFADPDPRWAAEIANGFTRMYQQMNMELRLQPAQRATGYFNEQIKLQRANLEAVQRRMSGFQQQKGITNVDENLDVESHRLKELTTQLVTVQAQLLEANSRQLQARGAGGAESSDVLANPMIQNLRVALASAEGKFAQVAERFTDSHPRYLEARAEVDRLRAALSANSRSASTGLSRNALALQQRQRELEAQVNAQKDRVLVLNRSRNELLVMAKEAESHQKAFDLLLQKQAQASVEGQSGQTEVTILNTATPALKPSSPILLLNLAVALLAGLLLGLGLALLAELRDRRIRSSQDLMDVLGAPVLGTVHWGAPSRPRIGGPRWMLPRPAT
ncbi:chain length determinant protein EpsF [Lacisediminimonas sp.]|uniref:chain length determinant protein EpsF n=1 Tax=Lacisediminimonas sp. TaxID=3060582 RepID=UPI0027220954|nr:chain length determinant protein EpsF [Lacisediminimonas sp.]MDO8300768.1 chain length determinant protein EpsF [Lacisediminimonas sp.]